MKLEKLTDLKFKGLKKHEISNLATIVGGTTQTTFAGSGNRDWSYGTNDLCWTSVASGDTASQQVGACS